MVQFGLLGEFPEPTVDFDGSANAKRLYALGRGCPPSTPQKCRLYFYI